MACSRCASRRPPSCPQTSRLFARRAGAQAHCADHCPSGRPRPRAARPHPAAAGRRRRRAPRAARHRHGLRRLRGQTAERAAQARRRAQPQTSTSAPRPWRSRSTPPRSRPRRRVPRRPPARLRHRRAQGADVCDAGRRSRPRRRLDRRRRCPRARADSAPLRTARHSSFWLGDRRAQLTLVVRRVRCRRLRRRRTVRRARPFGCSPRRWSRRPLRRAGRLVQCSRPPGRHERLDDSGDGRRRRDRRVVRGGARRLPLQLRHGAAGGDPGAHAPRDQRPDGPVARSGLGGACGCGRRHDRATRFGRRHRPRRRRPRPARRASRASTASSPRVPRRRTRLPSPASLCRWPRRPATRSSQVPSSKAGP